MEQTTDAELLAASRRGEHAAFGALVERYQQVVCAVSYSRTGDRALSEDVAQDTFIAAWRQLDQLHDVIKLRPWLCGIARHLASKARKRTEREVPFAGEQLGATTPFDDAIDAESERVVWDALTRVPETYREVMVLYYREQQSAREVALALSISEAAVGQRLARGRACLAASVTDLVERSLRDRRTRKRLVAAVVAALPFALGPSRVDASPPRVAHKGPMIKFALLAAALTTAATTAVVVHHHASDDPSSTPIARSTDAPTSTTPIRPAAARAALPPVLATAPSPHGPDGSGGWVAPAPELTPSLDRATLHRLGLDRGPSRGPADAPVTIVLFTDAICPYCGAVLASIDQVWDDYPDKLQLIVKQFPVHRQAMLAAEAAYAADAQGAFWGMHDLMFANQDDLSEPALVEYARQLGLDTTRFRDALDHHTYHADVAADQAAGRDAQIVATPSFLINGRLVTGARPVAVLRTTIDAALADH